jgi:hypothetical protein
MTRARATSIRGGRRVPDRELCQECYKNAKCQRGCAWVGPSTPREALPSCVVAPIAGLSLFADGAEVGASGVGATMLALTTVAYVAMIVWVGLRRRRRRRQALAAQGPSSGSAPLASALERPEHPAEPMAARPAIAVPAPPASPAARRLRGETLDPLGARLDRSRRLAVAEARVGEVLDRLPRDRWLVERYVLVAGQRVPFLLVGETGVFCLWAFDEAPGWEDLRFVNRAAAAVQELLPGYAGDVRVGLCRAFDPVTPRWWFASQSGSGAWLLGLNWLEQWLAHFGDAHGFADADVAWTARLAGPRWRERRRAGALPRTPNVG